MNVEFKLLYNNSILEMKINNNIFIIYTWVDESFGITTKWSMLKFNNIINNYNKELINNITSDDVKKYILSEDSIYMDTYEFGKEIFYIVKNVYYIIYNRYSIIDSIMFYIDNLESKKYLILTIWGITFHINNNNICYIQNININNKNIDINIITSEYYNMIKDNISYVNTVNKKIKIGTKLNINKIFEKYIVNELFI